MQTVIKRQWKIVRDSDKKVESQTTKKIEVSFAKSLAFGVNNSGKSLMQTENNKCH